MISVYVRAQSPITRAGLEALVRSNGALSLAPSLSSADVLMQALPRPDESSLARLAAEPIPVLLLAEISDSARLADFLRGSVRGVLSPDAAPEEISAAIAAIAAGLVALDPAALERLKWISHPPTVAGDEPLTAREIEVLAMLADGHSNKVIAYRLGISEHTVKFHVTSILAKLHAGTRTEAVTQGIRRGLILV